MGNDGQQPPLPPQAPGQAGHYGWQYEQDMPGNVAQQPPVPMQPPVQQSPAIPPMPLPMKPPVQQSPAIPPMPIPMQPPVQQSPASPPMPIPIQQQPPIPGPIYPQQGYPGQGPQQRPLPPRYQEPIPDMGSSLGYSQGIEYQYYNAPQPSQPIPMLRQARLQQLREDRMRRHQRRIKSDGTGFAQGKASRKLPAFPQQPPYPAPGANGQPAAPQQWGRGPDASPPLMSGAGNPAASPQPYVGPVPVPTKPGPAFSLPILPTANRARKLLERSLGIGAPPPLRGASEASQDTGMVQRVTIRRATFILTGAFIASRVLGLVRTFLFASVFGTNAFSDAYLQAFIIPDTIFNMVAGGALSSAFIPVFTKYMVGEHDEKSAWHVASSALNLALAMMVVVAAIVMIFAGQIVPLYNLKPATMSAVDYTSHINLIVALARIMLLQAIVLGGGVIINAVLNARQHFLLPAVGTVLYNVGIIIGLLPGIFLAVIGHKNDTFAVYSISVGVVLGAVLQVAIQIPGLRRIGMRYNPRAFDWRHPGVIQVGRQMIPRIINAAMLSLSTFVDRFLISFLGVVIITGSVSGLITQYFQALQLLMLPLSIFGMSIATAAFPTMAENVAKGRIDRFRDTVQETLRSILFTSIPSSIGLIVLALPIIQVLLQHGAYTLLDAQQTVFPLTGYAIGLVGLAAVEILTRSFYAMRDSTTPVVVSVVQFIFKIALSLLIINVAVWGVQWGTGALALSTSVAALLEAAVLLWLLQQRVGGLELRVLGRFALRVLMASLAMGVGVLVVRFFLDLVLVTTAPKSTLGILGTLLAIIKLAIELFVGLFIYVRAARMLGIEEMGPVKRILDRLKLTWI